MLREMTISGQLSNVSTPSLWRWPECRSSNYKTRKYNHRKKARETGYLVIESPVRVLPEERLSHGWKSIYLQQSQTLLESVVDLDLALSAHNNDTTGTES